MGKSSGDTANHASRARSNASLSSPDLPQVQPGAIRFGALRAGGVYRLPVFLKNLDVDVTRYTIKPLEEPYPLGVSAPQSGAFDWRCR